MSIAGKYDGLRGLCDAARSNVVVKDRKYRLHSYPQCFVASELIDWLSKDAGIDRQQAVELAQRLKDANYIVHVSDAGKKFDDAFLFFRFTSQGVQENVNLLLKPQLLFRKDEDASGANSNNNNGSEGSGTEAHANRRNSKRSHPMRRSSKGSHGSSDSEDVLSSTLDRPIVSGCIFGASGLMTACTFARAVQRAVHCRDRRFMLSILYCCNAFEASMLFDIFSGLYASPNSTLSDWGAPVDVPGVRRTVINYMTLWLWVRHGDFNSNKKLLSTVSAFLMENSQGEEKTKAQTQILRRALAPVGWNFRTEPVEATVTSFVLEFLWKFPVTTVAEEMCHIAQAVLLSVEPEELLNKNWMRSDDEQGDRAPHVVRLRNRFNQMSMWAASAVVALPTPREQLRMVAWLVELASALLGMCEFNGAGAICSGLQSMTVSRLPYLDLSKYTQYRTQSRQWEELTRVFEVFNNMRDYRAAHARALQAHKEFVPYIPLHLRDLLTLSESNSEPRMNSGATEDATVPAGAAASAQPVMFDVQKVLLIGEAVHAVLAPRKHIARHEPVDLALHKCLLNLPFYSDERREKLSDEAYNRFLINSKGSDVHDSFFSATSGPREKIRIVISFNGMEVCACLPVTRVPGLAEFSSFIHKTLGEKSRLLLRFVKDKELKPLTSDDDVKLIVANNCPIVAVRDDSKRLLGSSSGSNNNSSNVLSQGSPASGTPPTLSVTSSANQSPAKQGVPAMKDVPRKCSECGVGNLRRGPDGELYLLRSLGETKKRFLCNACAEVAKARIRKLSFGVVDDVASSTDESARRASDVGVLSGAPGAPGADSVLQTPRSDDMSEDTGSEDRTTSREEIWRSLQQMGSLKKALHSSEGADGVGSMKPRSTSASLQADPLQPSDSSVPDAPPLASQPPEASRSLDNFRPLKQRLLPAVGGTRAASSEGSLVLPSEETFKMSGDADSYSSEMSTAGVSAEDGNAGDSVSGAGGGGGSLRSSRSSVPTATTEKRTSLRVSRKGSLMEGSPRSPGSAASSPTSGKGPRGKSKFFAVELVDAPANNRSIVVSKEISLPDLLDLLRLSFDVDCSSGVVLSSNPNVALNILDFSSAVRAAVKSFPNPMVLQKRK